MKNPSTLGKVPGWYTHLNEEDVSSNQINVWSTNLNSVNKESHYDECHWVGSVQSAAFKPE